GTSSWSGDRHLTILLATASDFSNGTSTAPRGPCHSKHARRWDPVRRAGVRPVVLFSSARSQEGPFPGTKDGRVEFELSEEHRLVQSTVREWAASRLLPLAAEMDRTATYPPEVLRELGDLGLMGGLMPEE